MLALDPGKVIDKVVYRDVRMVVLFSAVSGLIPAKSEKELFPAPTLFNAWRI